MVRIGYHLITHTQPTQESCFNC